MHKPPSSQRSRRKIFFVGVVSFVVPFAFPAAVQRSRQPDVRYVPTPQNIVEAMLDMARVTPNDVVYDLGSGDGRIPITAAKKFGARGVGIEIEPRLIRESNDNAAKAGVADRVWFLNQSFWDVDLSGASVVTLFLLPRVNQELMPKLKRLRPGTRIVSHYYDMGPQWPPDRSQEINSLTIYLWTVK
jgi:tRNA G37 N-methylase Trm5